MGRYTPRRHSGCWPGKLSEADLDDELSASDDDDDDDAEEDAEDDNDWPDELED